MCLESWFFPEFLLFSLLQTISPSNVWCFTRTASVLSGMSARVSGKQDVTIPFASGQLNDVLKSLTVLGTRSN